MSIYRLRQRNVPPLAPASGKAAIYYYQDGKLYAIDSSGNIVNLVGLSSADYRLTLITNIFQGTTTYTPTAGIRALYVECIGAGGGGGNAVPTNPTPAAGGGGGGGAYSAIWLTDAAIKSSYAVVVGAGGTTNQVGHDTTFDSPSVCTAQGGRAGVGGVATTGPAFGADGGLGGASASGIGDIKLNGKAGYSGIIPATAVGGNGGAAAGLIGGGGRGGRSNAVGSPGGQYGGGGGGGAAAVSTTFSGGTGGNGLIRVSEYM